MQPNVVLLTLVMSTCALSKESIADDGVALAYIFELSNRIGVRFALGAILAHIVDKAPEYTTAFFALVVARCETFASSGSDKSCLVTPG